MAPSLDDFEHNLEKKYGPLPAWAWGGIVAGIAYILYSRWTKSKAESAALAASQGGDVAASDTTADADTSTDSGGASSSGFYDPAVDPSNPAYDVGGSAQGTPAPNTNAQWARLAADYLVSKGDDPTLVSSALAKYISGKGLSAAEHSIIDLALTAFGSPPEGLIVAVPVTPVTPPVPTTPVKKPGTTITDHGPAGAPLFPNQVHQVGKPGITVNLASYIRQNYPNATAAQQAQIEYATIAANRQYDLGSGNIPGGAKITLYSQAVK